MTQTLSNNPPSQIEFCLESTREIGKWMADNPVIDSEDKAREAKLLVDRAKAALKDLESERDGKVRPLNQQVAKINSDYRPARIDLGTALELILGRIDDYIKALEAERIRIAEAAAQAAEAARLTAEEAARKEQEAFQDAEDGVVVDVVSTAIETDQAFKEADRATRVAARAEKETNVRIGGGFGRVLSRRSQEVLTLVNPIAAIYDMGFTESLIEAILSEARAFRKAKGRLPEGVKSEQVRKL